MAVFTAALPAFRGAGDKDSGKAGGSLEKPYLRGEGGS